MANPFIALLTFLGRNGSRAVAISLFAGMAVPPLSALVKPLLPAAVFALLMLAMIRIETDIFHSLMRKPLRLVLIALWLMAGMPAVVSLAVLAAGLPESKPDLALALVLAASAPPVMAAAIYCFLLKLNGTLAVIGIVLAMLVTPLTAPIPGWLVMGDKLPISPQSIGLQLFAFLAGAAYLAFLIRRIWGETRIHASANLIDGLNVVFLFVFAVAIMDGVLIRMIGEPGLALALTALSFLIAGVSILLTALVFRSLGARDAVSLGLIAGIRNMGLMASTMVAAVPELTWTYFALAQFPIYLMPQIIRPVLKRIGLAGENPAP
ncbi:MAG: sodium:proton symporter [Hyphomicrobiales bacterium]|nr:sodium:proton symporter [Hyphomicrobiales bacterium]